MSYHEIKSIVAVFSTLLINGLYGWYVLQRYQQQSPDASEQFRFWAVAMLVLIGVAIVAQILITIVFSIAYRLISGESEPSVTDERDEIIELRSIRNAHYTFALGLVIAMLTQVLNMPPVAMFVAMFFSGMVSEIVQALTQLHYYRRGV